MHWILVIAFAFTARCCLAGVLKTQGSFSVPFADNMRLGYFYDVDKFHAGVDSPFVKQARDEPMIIEHPSSNFLYKTVTSSKEKRDLLDIKGSLSLKIKALNGIDINASGQYLKDTSKDSSFVEILALVRYVKETRTMTRQSEKKDGYIQLAKNAVNGNHFHYVRSITYGGELIASLKFTKKGDSSITDIQAEASLDVKATAVDVSVKGKFQKLAKDLSKNSNLEANVFITGGKGSPGPVTSVDELNTLIEKFIEQMSGPDGAVVPISASLVPISQLVPNDLVTQQMQFVMDRALEATSARFDEYMDDLLQSKRLFKDISDMILKLRVSAELRAEARELYSEVGQLTNTFKTAVQKFSFDRRKANVNEELMSNAIKRYNEKIRGNLPQKYVRAARTLKDRMLGLTVQGSVPDLLRRQLVTYVTVMTDAVGEQLRLSKSKVKCARRKKVNTKEVAATKDLDLFMPGFAMNVHTDETVPKNTPISFSPSSFDEDLPMAFFNEELAIPSTTAKDYYRNEIMRHKKTLSRILRRKKSHRRHHKHIQRDGNQVAMFQDPNVVAPLSGVYLFSYSLYNRGTVTEIVTPEPCDNGWTLHNNQCYLPTGDEATFPTATQACAAKGAKLVTVATEEDRKFVHELQPDRRQWVALQKVGGAWKWYGQTAATNIPWSFNEPNDYQGMETHVEMYTSGKLNDIFPNRMNYYTCVKGKNTRIESKGLIQVRVKKGSDDLSTHRSRSETTEADAGSKCVYPAEVLPISKPILAKLTAGDKVHVEQSVEVEREDDQDNFLSGVLLSAVSA